MDSFAVVRAVFTCNIDRHKELHLIIEHVSVKLVERLQAYTRTERTRFAG